MLLVTIVQNVNLVFITSRLGAKVSFPIDTFCVLLNQSIQIDCKCNSDGSNGCDADHGQCFCNENIEGKYCDHCADNFFGFPNCQGLTTIFF